MPLELIRDTLNLNRVVGEGQSQTLVDRDIIVPDIKPDIDRILSIEGKVNITGKDIEQDRIVIEGIVNVDILYSAIGEPLPIYAMSQSANFSHYINIPGAMPKMDSDVKCGIEHIDYSKVNGRKLNIQCVLNMDGKVNDTIPVEIVKEIGGIHDIQFMRDTVSVDEVLGDSTAQTVVRSAVEIPLDIPEVDEVIKYRAMVHKKDVDIEEDRVVITASVLVPILFSTNGEDAPDIYRIDEDAVFTYTMEMPGVMPGMECSVDYSIEDIYVELKENEEDEKRQMNIEAVVGMRARVWEKNEFPVLVDVYAPSTRMECERKNVAMDLYLGRNSAPLIIKESLQIPEVEKVYDMVCKPTITDYRIVDDKVAVEGVLGCDVVYLSKGEERAVSGFSEEIPFKVSVDVPGCSEGMKPEVDIDIEDMDFSILTKNEVEVKVNLDCKVEVYDKVIKELIVKAEEMEPGIPFKKASITIYMVQPRDTLWKIAKRYYTTIDDIVKANEIQGPDTVTPGMKLIIPRKV